MKLEVRTAQIRRYGKDDGAGMMDMNLEGRA